MLTHDTTCAWQPARRPGDPVRAGRWSTVPEREQGTAAAWGAGRVTDDDLGVGWGEVATADAGTAPAWGEALPKDIRRVSGWSGVPAADSCLWLAWSRRINQLDSRLRLIYRSAPPWKDTAQAPGWNRCDEFGQTHDAAREMQASLYVPGGVLEFGLGGRRYTPSSVPMAFFDFRYTPPAHVIQPRDSGAVSSWGLANFIASIRTMPWGWGSPADPVPTGIRYPDFPGPVVVIDPPQEPDILETYMIANEVTLVVLPSGTPVQASNIRLDLDIDSFAWTFSCDLFGRTSLNQVVPDANGPKTVELSINGWVWRFMIERWSGSGKHPAEKFTISGASRTRLLAAPYAPKRSAVNTAPINARQVVDDQLQNTGFTASWDYVNLGPPDWTLPPNAFSYQDQTPMEVIHRLAGVAGGVVRPDLAGDGLTVLPRYREAMWLWGSAVPDRIIAGEIIAEWGSEWSPQPQWNFVYVSGTTAGVGVQVRRAGTAGDEPAPDVMEDWMTGVDAARSRGISELSKGGDQSIETRRIPLFHKDSSAPGLVLPAMLVECRDEATPWRGLCLGTGITASGVGACEVWQTLKIERHYGSS